MIQKYPVWMLRLFTVLLLFVFATLGGCASSYHEKARWRGQAGGTLTGHYHKDKGYLFPPNYFTKAQKIYIKALLEGAQKEDFYEPAPYFVFEQNLAIEYDAHAYLSMKENTRHASFGITLGKVGRWNGALEASGKLSNRILLLPEPGAI